MDEIGTFTIERRYRDEVGNYQLRARVTHADRRIRIAHLDDIRSGDPYFHLDGDVLTIRDDYGQQFIYRIRWDDYRDGGYLAEWPD